MSWLRDLKAKREPEVTTAPVPRTFWCGHWFEPGTKKVIPDGADCCFIHWIGLPVLPNKAGVVVRHPLYHHQELIIERIIADDGRLYLIIKAPKLGITELWLRFAIWKSLVDPAWSSPPGQVVIVVGTGKKEAERMIRRCRDLMDNPHHPVRYDFDFNNARGFKLGKVEFVAQAVGNYEEMRSKTNMRLLLVDEGALTQMVDDTPVKMAAEHYRAVGNYYLVFVSTAGRTTSSFMHDLQKNTNYNRFIFSVDKGYGVTPHPESGTTILVPAELEKIKKEGGATYRRDYLCIWGGGSGGIFDSDDLIRATRKYRIEHPAVQQVSALGVDPAYGMGEGRQGARFGLVGAYIKNDKIHVCEVHELKQPSQKQARDAVMRAADQGYTTVCVDSAEAGLCSDLEQSGYPVNRVNFAREQSPGNLKPLVKDDSDAGYMMDARMIDVLERNVARGNVVIHPKFDDPLIGQLRSITRNERGLPNKKLIRFDVGDALQMVVYELNNYLRNPA